MSTNTQDSARRSHFDVLLHKLTAHADVIRHHIPSNHHNYTLGFAAEAGVRDMLRQVLPQRFAITSGFVRTAGGDLIVRTTGSNLSGQTDVIVYDAMHACPLYAVEGVELVAAEDVLAVIEVKDTKENELPGTCSHTKALARAVPNALRGIVLIQAATLNSTAEKNIRDAQFDGDDAPHVIYCQSLGENHPYLAFHERLNNVIHFWNYTNDKHSALVGFLRIVASFFATKGLCSSAIFPDLRPQIPPNEDKKEPISLSPTKKIKSLSTLVPPNLLWEERTAKLRELFDPMDNELVVGCPMVIGFDDDGYPTAGPTIIIRTKDEPAGIGAFFIMNRHRALVCSTDRHQTSPWTIAGETVDAYLKREFALQTHRFVNNIFSELDTSTSKRPSRG